MWIVYQLQLCNTGIFCQNISSIQNCASADEDLTSSKKDRSNPIEKEKPLFSDGQIDKKTISVIDGCIYKTKLISNISDCW